MIDRHPWLDALAHAVLIIGVLLVAFPVYVAVIASTHGSTDFMSGLVPLLPGHDGALRSDRGRPDRRHHR